MCTIKCTALFIEQTKNVEIPNGYEMILFDVKSLLKSIPLERRIELALQRIYTQIPRKLMKELLLLYIKKVHFIYENGICQQKDSVAMC